MDKKQKNILWFADISNEDVALVGGKNASLGEMYNKLVPLGIKIPNGFCVSAFAYFDFLKTTDLDKKIKSILKDLDAGDIKNLQSNAKKIRTAILGEELSEELKKEISQAYEKLCAQYGENTDVAVRSSATAEDLPSASFAGQHETYLNVRGSEAVIEAVKKSFASLFTARAVSYREERGFGHSKIALSAGVQKMVRSDLASSGVMFTLDTESGFRNVVFISSVYGIGEIIVQGRVVPDEFYVTKSTLKEGFRPIIMKKVGLKSRKIVYSQTGRKVKMTKVNPKERKKFSITEDEVLTLAKWGVLIEEHYSKKNGSWQPMDIEWAKDGKTGELFVVQARPETVHSQKDLTKIFQYKLKGTDAKPILVGQAIGDKIVAGCARVLRGPKDMSSFKPGEVLITTITDPDWEPIMKIASAIITERGGRTSHAAIVSRELGIPAVVGVGKATEVIKNGEKITIDCSSGGEGKIYSGILKWTRDEIDLKVIPKTETQIMMNLGSTDIAFEKSFLPVSGVGLAREEFIIASKIRVHPLALVHYNDIKDKKLKKEIDSLTFGYKKKVDYFVNTLAEGIGQIATAFWPNQIIVRFSDFKTNEYAALLGGGDFEPEEENPMLGWRGAARYYDPAFEPAFRLECLAIQRARKVFGLKNIAVMIPFCRTIEEGGKVLALMKKYGIERGSDGLKAYVMCEIPSNIVLADEFLEIFDGMSIGSNDLTQLVMGIDRDNERISHIADERNEAVKKMISEVAKKARSKDKYIGICGQAPSDFPEFAAFLVRSGVHSISLNPDAVVKTIFEIAKEEKKL